MSQDNNLGKAHISTSEDAFEKFQSVMMYEEDEFFTLSDIVPPQPVVPDLSNEIPYDNEVVLSSSETDHTQNVKCTLESSHGQSNEPVTQILDTTCKQTKRIKKVSKSKTKSHVNNSAQDDYSNGNELVSDPRSSDTSAIQDSLLSTTVVKNDTDFIHGTLQESKYPHRTRRERFPNTSKYPLAPGKDDDASLNATPSKQCGRPIKKRRGRPKKSLQNLTVSEPDSTNIDTCMSLSNDNVSSSESGKSLKSLINQNVKAEGKHDRDQTSLVPTNIEPTKPHDISSHFIKSDIDTPAKNTRKKFERGSKNTKENKQKLLDKTENVKEPNEDSQPETTATNVQIEVNDLSTDELVNEGAGPNSEIDLESLISNVSILLNKNVINEPITSTDKKLEEPFLNPDMDLNNDDDDICLSKLKENINNITNNLNEDNGVETTHGKRNTKVPLMADFEYNIDKVVKEASLDNQAIADIGKESLLVEDTSKRPNRRKAKQNFKYDEDSDEDPFANIELSDDEPKNRKKGRYDYDGEYIPGNKKGFIPISSSDTDSELNEELGEVKKQKRKKSFKNTDGQSPKKRNKKKYLDEEVIDRTLERNKDEENKLVESLESSVTKPEEEKLSMKPPAEAWATSNEFENFIAQKIQGTSVKIKKVSKQKSENVVTPLEIPVVDQIEPKMFIEISTQTYSTPTTSTGIQTSVPYDMPMKINKNLSSEQSQKACEFLNSVVKTTVELGQLMKEKSEDFMKKKINAESVTDTFKMDYCVRKSFLLFKLAKHNLMQMEEDLAKQYDDFLKSNKLSSCRETIKNVTPKPKVESDSDCEIVDVKEVPASTKTTDMKKQKFNPKTVFLNKELSIKIAKKPSTDKSVDIKKRHTVWINDAVMVKKVKPTQSFLAQDSRNKKPPDYITEKMVSDFFEDYYRQKALAVCAPYIQTDWSKVNEVYACHYFVKCNDFDGPDTNNSIENNASTSNSHYTVVGKKVSIQNNPKSLSALCIEVVHKCLQVSADNTKKSIQELSCNLTHGKNMYQPFSLFRLSFQVLSSELQNSNSNKTTIIKDIENNQSILTVPPLKTLCYREVALYFHETNNDHSQEHKHKHLFALIDEESISEDWQELDVVSDDDFCCEKQEEDVSQHSKLLQDSNNKDNVIKSLFTLCVESIQNNMFAGCNKLTTLMMSSEKLYPILHFRKVYPLSNSPRSLKDIVYETMIHFMYRKKVTECFTRNTNINQTDEIGNGKANSKDFTINCINTMSEEAFHSLKESHEFQDNYDYESDILNFEEDHEGDENEWASQVQMQILSSLVTSPNNIPADYDDINMDNTNDTFAPVITENNANVVNETQNQNNLESAVENTFLTAQVKLEPLDDVALGNVDSSIVKTELVHGLDGMTIIPESVMTKSEMIENMNEVADLAETQKSTYDVNTFEQFVRSNKMMRSTEEYSDSEEIFSQSALRIRRQHEPDYDAENDMNMSLLIPQTSEPLQLENAKGVLMESSSDESRMDSGAKKGIKKKSERKRGRQKKGKDNAKNSNSKETLAVIPVPTTIKEVLPPAKEKSQGINEVAMLTRRMREKIRQEEKTLQSSDSETENMPLSSRKDKSKLDSEKNKLSKIMIQGESSKINKTVDDEIQCNNVDSTEQILEKRNKSGEGDEFTGFSAIDQNEISSYHKYMQFVYDKIIPGDEDSPVQENASIDFDESMDFDRSCSPIMNTDLPVEMLECEPTMPIFDNDAQEKGVRTSKRVRKNNKSETITNQTSPKKIEDIVEAMCNQSDKIEKLEQKNFKKSCKADEPEQANCKKTDITVAPHNDETQFKECDGWHLYSIGTAEVKLYQNCVIPLVKLPESFVDTYLEYHDITDKDKEDKEVDRLANLQSLNRGIKEIKNKGQHKWKTLSNAPSTSEHNSINVTSPPSPANSDYYNELTPSEDEGVNVDDEVPPLVQIRAAENIVAKDSLMDDNESDSEGNKKIKLEPMDPDQVEEKTKPGPKSKTKMGIKANTKSSSNNKAKVEISPSSESLMLTADKMMNKELSLLYAPVNLKEEVKETPVKQPSPKEGRKSKRIHAKTMTLRDRLKTEDDSSSEEEKQWVSTKEKLLKKMGKKDGASVDDAKRAKLVDDFIERRGERPGKRRPHVSGGRRSRKKFLERLKQQRFLSKELFGESSTDMTPGSKRGAPVGLFKGRRNIRKVIDKKSLQKSTVLANMEEFERKRRLNARQNQLRELLGCEEGVNVLVINDEVCLEYDFQEQRPVVTVHPFFTKVMKAHQYEGVKFMWDACFESLQSIEMGRGGGGCILAHCMGLGKTLQVLALLHTVLTHPRVGMQRVLVCCPLSTVLNWVDEIHKWIDPVTDQIKVFELSKLKKTYERACQLNDWYSGGGIFIIGYELFRSLTTLDPLIDDVRPTNINKIRTALLDPGPDIVICDEGHLLKNDCSVLAVAMSRVVTKRRIILTGTPMQNNLREYYCMVNFVKPNLLGTYSEYSNRFENPIMNGQHRDSREEDIKLMKARTHILHKVLEGCLQRQEASVLYPYLPKKHEYTMFIPLTKCQWDLYKHYVHHYTKKSKPSVLKDFHILQKIWSHPQVLHNFQIKASEDIKKKEIKPEKLEDDLALEDKEIIKPPETETWWLQYLADGAMLDSLECSNKFVAVFRILHECVSLGDKVLIFSTSLFCLDALEYFLNKIKDWSLGKEYYRLDGSVPAEVRQNWCREFNAENNLKTMLFLISTRAGCLGLNMTAANRVIILDTSWNPAHDIQSIFRVYRFGQKKDCFIYRLVAMGTMEQKIYERSVTKQAVACRVVDEQQIDRHYNMAELTELYRFDELGSGVAGGVAVGVADVALLRVARDAAVHAVHEHDSLLRGSGEQGLPEHERAAAWMQFQQEHAHKQMQNDLESNQAAQALQLLQEQQLLQQQQAQNSQILNIKTEDGPVHDNLPVLKPEQTARGRGGKRRRGRRVVQCRIPIKQDEEQARSSEPPPAMDEAEMVQQISNILIQHNFTQSVKGPKQVKELVSKVRRMIQTREPMSLEGDDLCASIASVLLQQKAAVLAPPPAPPMPALTDIEEPRRTRGRPKKHTVQKPTIQEPPVQQPTIEEHPVQPLTVQKPAVEEHTVQEHTVQDPALQKPAVQKPTVQKPTVQNEPTSLGPKIQSDENASIAGNRRRRKAALAAERYFDIAEDAASQDSIIPEPIIDIDDDWQIGSDSDSAPKRTPVTEQKPPLTKILKGKKKKRLTLDVEQKKPSDSSIVLSDDEVSVVPEKPQSPPPVEEQVTPLHPSLLTNQNFIKIVAHTYLAGNPMLDEDAATLAAQYSAFKLMKESETTGNPIVSGPIYDIAIKVLGIEVLQKLQSVDPKSKERSNVASSQLMQLLGQGSSESTTPTVKKKPGPKSRVKQVKDEPKETPKVAMQPEPALPRTNIGGIVPVTLVKREIPTSTAAAPLTLLTSDECILPDDEDEVRCITKPPPRAPSPPSPLPPKPIKFKLKILPLKNEQDAKSTPQSPAGTLRVTAGKICTVPQPNLKKFDTICLDSDDEDSVAAPSPAPLSLSARAQRAARLRAALRYPSPVAEGPVPVALTGPNTQPTPLVTVPAPAAQSQLPSTQSGHFRFPDGSAQPLPSSSAAHSNPVPVSLTGPDSRPVPISFTGPDSRPIPISLTGPGFQGVPVSLAVPQTVPTSITYADCSQTIAASFSSGNAIPISFASSSGPQTFPMSFTIPSSMSGDGVQPVAMSFVGGSAGAPGQPKTIPMSAMRAVRFGGPSAQPPTQPGTVAQHFASNIYLVPTATAGERLLTRVPASQVPHSVQLHAGVPTPSPPATSPAATNQTLKFTAPNAGGGRNVCKPGDILRLTTTGQLEIVHSKVDDGVVHTIDDDEPPVSEPKPKILKPTPAKAPTVKSLPPKEITLRPSTSKPSTPKPSALIPLAPKPSKPNLSTSVPMLKLSAAREAPATPQQQTSLAQTKNNTSQRRSRMISTSSSGSSDSSRSPSPSPNPLSILKHVVHIQAPERRSNINSNKSETTNSKQTTSSNQNKNETVPKPAKTSNDKDELKDKISQKLNNILASVKARHNQVAGGKNTPSKPAPSIQKLSSGLKLPSPNIKESIDLTDVTNTNSTKSDATKPGMVKTVSAKPGTTKFGDSSKSNPNIGKTAVILNKEIPTYVVGTSKNIVLDGKSKSLTNTSMVDLTGQKSVQVTNVKTIPPSVNKQKPPEMKRPAPPQETTAPKKKKSELMTLKDFDLEDIDDIIELD